MNPLINLAECVEAATGPDRELDKAIVAEVQKGMRHPWFISPPSFTASLDAAMQLVPEGCSWGLTTSKAQGVLAEVYFEDADGLTYGRQPSSRSATPALALCAAALRAKAGEGV